MIDRANLLSSTGYAAFNGHNFFTRDDINIAHMPVWERVNTSNFGPVDSFKKGNVLKIPLRLWGAWENLSDLFPSYLMNPIPGTRIFGTSDAALTVQGRNNDLITYSNARLTRLANLYLGVDSDLFAADVEFTALLKNNANPEDANSYHTRGSNSYSEVTAAFAKTNWKRTRFTGAWGAISGFTAMTPKLGVNISWDIGLDEDPVDGLGVVDMLVQYMVGQAKCIPIGPSLAQVKTNSQEEAFNGILASTISGDLVWTGANSGPVVTLKNAYLKGNNLVFSPKLLRIGELTWETTRAFSTGTPAVVASVA
jgi:hypothetical protein